MNKILLLLSLAIVWAQAAFAQLSLPSDESGEILFICSYNADTQYSNEFADMFWKEYSQKGGKHKISVEAMNCHSLDSHKEWMVTMKEILNRHADPSLIILYGPEAWVCYLSMEGDKWRNIPLCMIASQRYGARVEFDDVPSIHRTSEDRSFTVDYLKLMEGWNIKMCYYYDYGVNEDVEIITHLNPDINTIAVIGDNSYSGYGMLRHAVSEINKNYPKLKVIEIDGSRETTENAGDMIRNLPSTSAIVYCIWRYDSKGTVSLSQANTMMAELPDIPIMTLTGRGFGEWALGGSNPQYDWKDGRISPALLAYELIDQNLDIEPYYYRCPNYYQFDMAIAKRLKIDTSKLPDGAVNINAVVSIHDFIDMYYTEFMIAVALVLVLVAALIIISVYSIRMKRMQHELQENEIRLRENIRLLELSEKNLTKAKDRAEASDRMKTHFIHNISHEIRTPLNAIRGFSEVILDPEANLDESSKKDLSQRICTNVDTVTGIVDDILELSDIESSEYSMNKTNVNCRDLCQSVVPVVDKYKNESVMFNISTDVPDDFSILTDNKLVRDVLVQLLKNACRFTTKGAVLLRYSLNENPGKMTFSVTDTGPGVPADKAEFIFERFKKLSDFAGGIGLGLSICRAVARDLDGEVYLDTSYTGGAKFIFTLPIE